MKTTVLGTTLVLGILAFGCMGNSPERLRAEAEARSVCDALRLTTLDGARTLCAEHANRATPFTVTCSQKKIDRTTTSFRVSVGVPALFGQVKNDERCAVKK